MCVCILTLSYIIVNAHMFVKHMPVIGTSSSSMASSSLTEKVKRLPSFEGHGHCF